MKKIMHKKKLARSSGGKRRNSPVRSGRGVAAPYPKRIPGMRDRFSDLVVVDLVLDQKKGRK